MVKQITKVLYLLGLNMCDPVSKVMAGAAVIGAVSSKSAADSARKSSKEATAMQGKAIDAQNEAAAAQLDFQKQQYDDWEAIYGPIQNNLSSFYQNLTPETFATAGLDKFEQQYQASQQQIQRSFAQRGISSPAQDMMNQQAALGAAESKASIRAQAPMQVATAQQGFLNQNTNNPASAGIANAYGTQSNIASNQASMYGNQATAANNNQAAAYNQMGQAIQGGVQGYTAYQQQQALQQQATTANMYGTTQGSEQNTMLAQQNAGLL